jgi:hypothetical protein
METKGRGVLGRPVEPGDDGLLCRTVVRQRNGAGRYSPFKPSGRGIRMML